MQPTQIEFQPSRQLRALVAAMSVLALGAIALASLPSAVRLVLAGVLLASVVAGLHRLRQPLPRLRLAANGQILIGLGDDRRATEVLPSSFVAPALCVLRLRTDDGRIYSLTLLPDSADADALRRLRVSLRWVGPASRTRSGRADPDAG
jgi:toxin CptA